MENVIALNGKVKFKCKKFKIGLSVCILFASQLNQVCQRSKCIWYTALCCWSSQRKTGGNTPYTESTLSPAIKHVLCFVFEVIWTVICGFYFVFKRCISEIYLSNRKSFISDTRRAGHSGPCATHMHTHTHTHSHKLRHVYRV